MGAPRRHARSRPVRLVALLVLVLAGTGCIGADPPPADVDAVIVPDVPLSTISPSPVPLHGEESLPLVPPEDLPPAPDTPASPTPTPVPTVAPVPAQGDPVGTCRAAGAVLEAVEPLVVPRPAGDGPPLAAYQDLAAAANGLLGADTYDDTLQARISTFIADTGVVLADVVAGTDPAARPPEVQAAFTRFAETVPELETLMSALCEQAAALGIGGVPPAVCGALAPVDGLEAFPEGAADYNAVVGAAGAALAEAEDASTVAQQTDALVAGQAWWAALGAVGPSASFDLRVARDLVTAPIAYVAVPYDAMLGRCGIG